MSIVSHGQQDLILPMLDSLDNWVRLGGWDLKINIVDNLNNENWTNLKFENFNLIEFDNEMPMGFGANQNKSFNLSSGLIFCVANPDLLFFEPFNLDDFAQKVWGKRAIASPILLGSDQKNTDFIRERITAWSLIKRKFGKNHNIDGKNFDWIAGACLCFDAEFFAELRGFDERYHMYVEDCDLCDRAVEAGGVLAISTGLRAIHHAQRKSRQSLRMLASHTRSLAVYGLTNLFCRLGYPRKKLMKSRVKPEN